MTLAEVRIWLGVRGVPPGRYTQTVLDSFDFSQPAYEQMLFEGDIIFQFIRLPSLEIPNPALGNWFCLSGAATAELAIFDGIAGRRLHKFRVNASFLALEGTASQTPLNWRWAFGGVGGATQIYVPPSYIRSLTAIATDTW